MEQPEMNLRENLNYNSVMENLYTHNIEVEEVNEWVQH